MSSSAVLEQKTPNAAALSDPFYGGHSTWEELDRLEADMEKSEHKVDLTVRHLFTPGLYIREIFMPAGTRLISKIHKTEHPYVISKGKVGVWTEEDGVVTIEAPHTGITKPGTRRLLYIYEDTIWSTFHVTSETDVKKIEDQIIFKREKTALPETSKQNEIAA